MGESLKLMKLWEQFEQLAEDAENKKARTTNSDHLEWYIQDARRIAFTEAAQMVQSAMADSKDAGPSYRDQVTQRFKVEDAEIIEIQPLK